MEKLAGIVWAATREFSRGTGDAGAMEAALAMVETSTRNAFGIPLRLAWSGAPGRRPVPQRVIRSSKRGQPHEMPDVFHGNGYHANGLPAGPFDFSRTMFRLCRDIVSRCEAFHHIDVDRILFTVSQACKSRRHGLQAKVTPMRFQDGQIIRQRGGRFYQVQRYWVDRVEMLYLMTFCLPRFLDQSFDQKFVTIFHELYHIAPEFNGDLRRHGGRCSIHTRSKKGYDRHMAQLVREYLDRGADPSLHAFLRLSFQQIESRHETLFGLSVPTPKLVPLAYGELPTTWRASS